MNESAIRVCFVCLGNICRSPTAEGVMRHLVRDWASSNRATAGQRIEIESAGTAAYHVGERPDPRSRAAAQRRGISLDSRAQQFGTEDWHRFDLVLAMDAENRSNLEAIAEHPEHLAKLFLLRDFDPDSPPEAEVPDPYYTGDQGFEDVLDLCDAACRGLLARLEAGLRSPHDG